MEKDMEKVDIINFALDFFRNYDCSGNENCHNCEYEKLCKGCMDIINNLEEEGNTK